MLKPDQYHLYNPAIKAGYESYFFKDTSKQWYHTVNTEEIKQQLCKIVKDYQGRVIFFGNSLGGYAAMYFGLYAMPSKIITFSPQTSTEFYDISLKDLYKNAENRPIVEIHRC